MKGRIYDVSLDLREESPTFGKWYGVTLSEGEDRALFIPAGFAHGFMALEDDTLSPISARTTMSRATAAVSCGMMRTWPSHGRFRTASY